MAVNNEADILNEVSAQWTDEASKVGVLGVKKGSAVLKSVQAWLERAKSSGNKQLIIQCEVLEHDSDPTAVNDKVVKRFPLEFVGPDGMKNLQRLNSALINLGLPVITNVREQIPQIIAEFNKGLCFNAQIEPQEDPQWAQSPNIYINANARRRDKEVLGSSSGTEMGKPADAKF